MNGIKEPSLLRCLPAIFQEKAKDEGNPLKAFLLLFDRIFSGIEERIDHIDTYFDPFLASSIPDKNGRDFLSWLASWVSLNLDEEWHEPRKRYIVKNIAQLYHYRGSIQGLKFMLEQFFEIQVEIKEWAWPRGMELGIHSTIGLDTFLIDKSNLNHCFTVIWRPTDSDISPDSIPESIIKVDTFLVEKPILNRCFMAVKKSAYRDISLGSLIRIKKARSLIDQEKPAHTKCFFLLEYPEK